jgi:hypothetical protein
MANQTLLPRALRRIWSQLPPPTGRRLIAQWVFLLLRPTPPVPALSVAPESAQLTIAMRTIETPRPRDAHELPLVGPLGV